MYKYFDDFGPYLAGLLTYYGVVSLFPLLLLASTVLGIVLVGHPHLQHELITSALHQFPGIGDDLATPKQIEGGTAGPGRRHRGLAVRRPRRGAGVPVRVQHGLGRAAQQQAQPVPGPRPGPAAARHRGLAMLGTTVLSILGGTGAGELGFCS